MNIKKNFIITITLLSTSFALVCFLIYESCFKYYDLYSKIDKQTYMTIPIIAIILFMALGILIHLFLVITNLIVKLNKMLDNTSSYDPDKKCKYTKYTEIGSIIKKFNKLIENLNSKYGVLEDVQEELTQSKILKAKYKDLLESQQYLKNVDEKYRLALDNANDAIWEWDFNTKNLFATDKWYEITGYNNLKKFDFKFFLGNLIHPDDVQIVIDDLSAHIKGTTNYYRSEFRVRINDEQYKWVYNKGKILYSDDGKKIKLSGSLSDITERKKVEEQVSFLAYYDILTKLPNRTHFTERLIEEIEKSSVNNTLGAVLFIDLDNFKNVNDTLGHNYGDELLIQIARKLEKVIGKEDVPCRLGGDEFLILLTGLKGHEEAARCAKETLKILKNVFEINSKQVYVTGSIGIAFFPKDGTDHNILLKNADTAMYKAKEAGKNKYVFFDHSMLQILERKTKIEGILRNAIANNELQLYYQPQYTIRTGAITGFEALLRLVNEELGCISPTEFIPIAEESGIIVELGEWCLRKACLKNKELKDKGYKYECIGVNISAIQLQQHDFTDMIKNVLSEVDLDPAYLEIELTETVLMKSLDNNVAVLSELRALGVKVALDDFGTGYSSLNYLRKIPLNSLKVDRSFIDGMKTNSKEQDIAYGIIQIAHNINLEVVAEGVEHQSQLELLKEKQCDKVQGFLYCKPLHEDEIEKVLKENMEFIQKNKMAKKHEFKYTGLYSRASKIVDLERSMNERLEK